VREETERKKERKRGTDKKTTVTKMHDIDINVEKEYNIKQTSLEKQSRTRNSGVFSIINHHPWLH